MLDDDWVFIVQMKDIYGQDHLMIRIDDNPLNEVRR